jgi:3-isopropylmalate dehydrogenase
MFQPSHGTAPQLAGKNVANPLAMILSASMMLDWLADRHEDEAARNAAARIEHSVAKLLADGQTLTSDLGGSAKTSEVTSALIALFNDV